MVMADVAKFSMVGSNKFEDDPIGAVYSEAPDLVVFRMQFFGSQGRVKRVALKEVCFSHRLALYGFGQFLKQPIECGRRSDFKHDGLGNQFAQRFSLSGPFRLVILLRGIQRLKKLFLVQSNRVTKCFVVFFCDFNLNGAAGGL